MTIQYDGTDFHGWQVQAKGRTVQGDIENVLSIIYPEEKITVLGAGRTDAGVHALGLTANVKLPSKLSANELMKALNGNLNQDVRIDSAGVVEDDFHARFSATAREYEYRLVKAFSPITRNYTTLLKWNINKNLLNDCAKILVGEHDFTSFCKATAEVENKICTVFDSKWDEANEMIIFTIKANRFLQHMVRYLVGTMLEVARGRYTLEDFQNLLTNEKSKPVVVRAPAQGLLLKKVYYE
ncbi:MAG: tRNA pseudouridine(38-40) synthase TruA [Candidatus Marinimicrobia bacterium]|nr:tRNA pseudouridine(38-40) synthase TruA [Candidatus Neomarinimicrobiota bacterium]